MILDSWPGTLLTQEARADFAGPGAGVTFEIVVPDGVCATSDSGLLPIVGGSCSASSDTTAPTTVASVDPAANAAGWNADPVTVRLDASDDEGGSGVASITYALNGGEATTVNGASASIPLDEGLTTVSYFATDEAGNQEPQQTLPVKIDETAPTLSLPDGVSVDATTPNGAPVSYGVSVSDNLDPAPGLTCSQASGSYFAIGRTQVACTATDAAGNRSSGSFVVLVKGAAEQIAELEGRIEGLGLPHGTDTSLQAKLDAAGSALGDGDTGGACLSLGDLRNEVAAQSGKKLPSGQANDLDAAAARIEAVLGC